MSERKRPRLRRCQICEKPQIITQHGKCYDCRHALQMTRYAVAGKLDKFRTPANRGQ